MCVSAAQLSHLVINEVDKCLTSFTALCSFVSLLNKTQQKCVDTPTRAVWQAKLTSSCPNCVMLLFVECCELSPSEGRQEEEHRGRRRGEENLYKITAFSLAGTSLASPHCGSVAVELCIIRSASWFITLETYLNNCLAASATPAPLLQWRMLRAASGLW